ncbi:uncharacterized protein LOC125443283 isoform X2 [Sphaerodactylus townsendi]|uniref:uncharacterized protein LOC125443283 isoform X2 n=1 Tax=Sphaerodactylus townsendi TaxID=933632 RepID=UPI002025C7DC|nr:uncharacterized protein LOC125443283 isoform X2 [Sphaerodactylus townsendi]
MGKPIQLRPGSSSWHQLITIIVSMLWDYFFVHIFYHYYYDRTIVPKVAEEDICQKYCSFPGSILPPFTSAVPVFKTTAEIKDNIVMNLILGDTRNNSHKLQDSHAALTVHGPAWHGGPPSPSKNQEGAPQQGGSLGVGEGPSDSGEIPGPPADPGFEAPTRACNHHRKHQRSCRHSCRCPSSSSSTIS